MRIMGRGERFKKGGDGNVVKKVVKWGRDHAKDA